MLWILAMALLPLVGSLAYVVVEILPEVFGGSTARARQIRRAAHDRSGPRLAPRQRRGGNFRQRGCAPRLGEELFERSQFDAAIDVYRGGLKGIFEHDPDPAAGLGAGAIRQAGLCRGAGHPGTI